jgi:hypothetical protein
VTVERSQTLNPEMVHSSLASVGFARVFSAALRGAVLVFRLDPFIGASYSCVSPLINVRCEAAAYDKARLFAFFRGRSSRRQGLSDAAFAELLTVSLSPLRRWSILLQVSAYPLSW